MFRLELKRLQRILVVGAHPDDIEIGCGGTLLRLLSESSPEVHWVVLSGNEERRAEARKSADSFLRQAAGREIEIQDFPDRYFPGNYNKIKKYFDGLGKRISPDLIFTHRREDLHQDHALVGSLTWNTFRNHLIFEYEVPKYEGDLAQPNIYVSIDEAQCAEKVDMIVRGFPSQKDKQWFDAELLRGMMRLRGIEADVATRYAEAFYCRKLVL